MITYAGIMTVDFTDIRTSMPASRAGLKNRSDETAASGDSASSSCPCRIAGLAALPEPEVSASSHTGPVIIASPHGGSSYPDGWFSKKTLLRARSLEDRGTSQLARQLAGDSRPAVIARTGRAVCDLNRPEDALDPLLCPHARLSATSPYRGYIQAGYAVIPRLSAAREPLHEHSLTRAETMEVIKQCHRPYHRLLRGLLDTAFSNHDHVMLIDLHSMPDEARRRKAKSGFFARRALPDFVFGNLHGATMPDWLVKFVDRMMADTGASWRWNSPYAGAYTTRHYGLAARPPQGKLLSVMQIEVNRNLFISAKGETDTAALYETGAVLGQLLTRTEAALAP